MPQIDHAIAIFRKTFFLFRFGKLGHAGNTDMKNVIKRQRFEVLLLIIFRKKSPETQNAIRDLY